MSKKKIGILGASGFTGLELIRVLSARDDIELSVLSSRSLAGTRVKDAFPEITSRDDLVFTSLEHEELKDLKTDLVFLAMENGKAMEMVPHIPCKVIDLSADFRFTHIPTWEKVYGMTHVAPHVKAVYGLPELFAEEIKTARVVANPGCFATASLLSALPLQGRADIERMVCDGKSGISGAGRKNSDTNNFNFLSENVIPYKITHHRHEAEIQQFFSSPISFTPHVVPMIRGMLVTTHVFFKSEQAPSREEIISLYEEFYKNAPAVEVVKNGLPEPRHVRMTNKCKLGGFEIDENGRMVIISVIDNLGKGASLQAIQNMDLMIHK